MKTKLCFDYKSITMFNFEEILKYGTSFLTYNLRKED
jgi:hypothetical protein